MRNKYSISEFITTAYSFVLTKLFYPRARLIRRPVYIRGKKSLQYGTNLTVGHGCRFDLSGIKKTLFIGDNCEFGDYTHIVAYERVEIGDNVLLASKIFISDTNHGEYRGVTQASPYVAPNLRPLITHPVTIGNNVWIGENVVILSGVRIGNGSIIGANSVVRNNIPDNCIAAGIPARVIKQWEESTQTWQITK